MNIIRASSWADLFDCPARWYAKFDPKCAHLTKVQISDLNREVAAIADLIRPNIQDIAP